MSMQILMRHFSDRDSTRT